MKAIVTKFHGPGNTRGSRYSATDNDGNRVIVSASYKLNGDDNHTAAALALCRKKGWTGTLVAGCLRSGQRVYVWLADHCKVEVPNAR